MSKIRALVTDKVGAKGSLTIVGSHKFKILKHGKLDIQHIHKLCTIPTVFLESEIV